MRHLKNPIPVDEYPKKLYTCLIGLKGVIHDSCSDKKSARKNAEGRLRYIHSELTEILSLESVEVMGSRNLLDYGSRYRDIISLIDGFRYKKAEEATDRWIIDVVREYKGILK